MSNLVVVLKNKSGLLMALKEFPKDSYFSARTHAMHLARNVNMYQEDEIQVHDQETREVLFTCTYQDMKDKTKVLEPWYPEED